MEISNFEIFHYRSSGECLTVYGRGVSPIKSIYVISFNTIAWLIPSVLAAFFYYKVCKAVWLSHDVSTARKIDNESAKSRFVHLNSTL